MFKINPIVSFLLVLTAILGLIFLSHTYLLDHFGYLQYGNLIVTSYSINAALAAFIYIPLYLLKNKLKNYIGYLFIAGSFLKFIFFFIFFYPAYHADGEMSKQEFAAFFVPYVICLVVETVFTSKMLKKVDKKPL